MSRILTSVPPSGPLHIGHYCGALAPFAQRIEPAGNAVLTIADVHLLAPPGGPARARETRRRRHALVAECIAAGIDPGHCLFYSQSQVPEISLLSALLQSLCTVGELSTAPSLLRRAPDPPGSASLGLLAWPVLEAADIMATAAEQVVIGAGNASHVALARDLAERLRTGWNIDLVLPEPVVSAVDLPGIDGAAKMSRSAGNLISLCSGADELWSTMSRTVMWDGRGRCVPGVYLAALGHEAQAEQLTEDIRAGMVQPAEAREQLMAAVSAVVLPISRRAAELRQDTAWLDKLLVDGAEQVRDLARDRLNRVLHGLGLAGG